MIDDLIHDILEDSKAEKYTIQFMNTFRSEILSLSHNDFTKALVVAVLTPVAGYVGQVLQAFALGGSFAIDWTQVYHLALAGFSGYLVKQFLSNSNGEFMKPESTQ